MLTRRAESSGRLGCRSKTAREASMFLSEARIRRTKSFPSEVDRSERVALAFFGSNSEGLRPGDDDAAARAAKESTVVGLLPAPSSMDIGWVRLSSFRIGTELETST